MPRGRLAVNVVQGALRRKEILELRTKGFSTAAIAERLSCGKTTVKRHLHAALEDLAAENLELAAYQRALDLARIDKLLPALIESAEGGDLDAASALEKLLRRRAAMLGYDMPVKYERTDDPPPPIQIFLAGDDGTMLPLGPEALSGGDDDAGDE